MAMGREKQLRLKQSRILVIGAGGIGSALLPALAAAGTGSITFYDPDSVEISNLGRQSLYREEDAGMPKGALAVNALEKLNPHIKINWVSDRIDSYNIENIINRYDLVCEGSDSIETKFALSDAAVSSGIPALIGGLGVDRGHIFSVFSAEYSDKNTPSACYRCVFEEPPPAGALPVCASTGVYSVLPAVIGSMMAHLAVITAVEKRAEHRLLLLEKMNWRSLRLEQNPECSFCSVE